MKKALSIFLALILCISVITGCSDKQVDIAGPDGNLEPKVTQNGETDKNTKPAEPNNGKIELAESFSDADDISYVMIYNPYIYDEYYENNVKKNTGDFSRYVEAVINKADGLEETELPTIIPQAVNEINNFSLEEFDLSGNRADVFITPYKVGDKHDFYCGFDSRSLETFECRYAGQYCNVWTWNTSMTDSQADSYGKEFDKNIYVQVTDMFGDARFADNGGKVNLLMYPMEEYLGGFFYGLDLFASGEVTQEQIDWYGVNTNHAIININSVNADYAEYMYTVIAHEFQHLICFTDSFYTISGTMMRSWLNEAMSGYIEEQLYPGAKELSGHYAAFAQSNRIRHGQSMYNFDTSTTETDFDIGVYGSVYLFSEYLANLAGDDIYSKIHSYWRDSYSIFLDEAEAIAESVPETVYSTIDSSIEYSDELYFFNEADEWLSKLTLDYYLSLLRYDKNDPKAYANVVSQTLLYDEINPADIEGGGRVIVSLKDGSFEIPNDADHALIYVGLNKDFEVVTDFIVK